jgi:uncharacterized protein YgbK (DUF1537 family)
MSDSLLLAFYGDDFTGSTDAMEALATNGYRTVLFVDIPTEEMLERFEGISCIGIAGTSRAKDPNDMEQELRPIFEKLSKLQASVIHYKVCSTFDSSPGIGSIGKAIELSRDYFTGQRIIPVLVGVPSLGRFTLFGQHFARMHDQVHRLDRHPSMSRHPVTPMLEADLRIHLCRQISDQITLMNILELDGQSEEVRERYERKITENPRAGILLFDVLDDNRLKMCGQLIWEEGGNHKQFVVGSSGVEYALTAFWKSVGIEPKEKEKVTETVSPADRLLVVSGSASPVTKDQIEKALQQGFYGIKITADQIADSSSMPQTLVDEVSTRLNDGQSVVIYTALGPDDESIAVTRTQLSALGIRDSQSGEFIGKQLGRWTKEIIKLTGIRRVVIAGGDTSGFVTREMDIFGLEMLLPVSPGAPLCKAYSFKGNIDGIEIALKGGQLGSPDYFLKVKGANS